MAAALPFAIAGVSAFSALSQGQQSAAASSQSAQLARLQATSALQQGVAQEDSLRRQQATFNGEQRAQSAQSGTGFGGSTLDIAKQNSTLQQLDLLNTRYNAQLQASGLIAQAQQDETAAKQAKSNALMSAAGAVAGGFGNSLRSKSILSARTAGYGNYA